MNLSRMLAALLLIAGLLPVTTSDAQYLRSDRSVFVKVGGGLSYYMGDNEKDPFSSAVDSDTGNFPYHIGAELGYQFSQPFSMSLGFGLGNYTEVTQYGPNFVSVPLSNPFNQFTNPEDYFSQQSLQRYHVQLLARYMFNADEWRLSPYVTGGLGVTFGDVTQLDGTDQSETAFGPAFGLGLDYTFGGRTSLFLEWLATSTTPDDVMDLRDDNGMTSLDFFSGFMLGIKFNFKEPFRPVALLGMEGPQQLLTEEVGTFTATANIGEATPPVTYAWDFGDGTTAVGETVSHEYQQAGTYTVTVTASNERSSDSQSMTVTVIQPVPAEILTMNATPMNPDTETLVRFTSNVRGDEPVTYQWDFGDGATATGQNPTHTFTEPGTYTVRLTVTNEYGTDTRTMQIAVEPAIPAICLEVTEMNSAFFGRNDSQLTPEARLRLEENAEILAQCPNLMADVVGYAAPGERNPMDLSQARANAVAQFYQDLGVPADRLNVRAMGRVEGVTTKKEGTEQYRRVDTIPMR